MKTFTKDPDALLDYGCNWAPWLGKGDTIKSSSWVVPEGITNEGDDHTDTRTTIWLSGGTDKTKYTLVNKIETEEGRKEDRTVIFKMKEN
ncbi:MAG: hypothetical protein DRH26_00755 [Deltaproteobacteria bacterium]|nr:MAG: hypothetical protein DRH26_00755 [Deltaproteobacteria bacterium]